MKNDLSLTINNIKAVEDDSGALYISGYANTIDKDRYGDIVLPSAFNMENYVKNPILLLQHEDEHPIGKVVEHKITDKGLWIKALISDAAEDLYKVKTLIKDGVLQALSIGFRLNKGKYIPEDDTFVITELELLEISVVSVPANQDSLFEVSKAFLKTKDDAKKLVSSEKELTYSQKAEMEKAMVTTVTTTETVENEVVTQTVDIIDTGDSTVIEDKSNTDSETEQKNEKENTMTIEVKAAVDKALEEARLADKQAEKEAKDLKKAEKAKQEAEDARIAEAVSKALAAREEKEEKEAGVVSTEKALETPTMQLSAADMDSYTKQVDNLYMLSVMASTPLSGIKAFQKLPEQVKAVVNTGTNSLAPQGFDSRLMEDVRRALKIEPLFANFNMPLADYRLPFNAAGVNAAWQAAGDTPVDQSATFKSVLFTAKKLMSSVAFNYEDEDDAVVALLPTIRQELAIAIATLLEDTLVVGTGVGNSFRGISHYAAGIGASHTSVVPGTVTADLTSADIATARAKMGRYGIDPSKVVLLVNLQDYYKLVDDANVATVDKFGAQATVLRGQLASVWGIPVIPTESIATPVGLGDVRAILVRPDRFKVGYRMGMNIETWRDPRNQTKSLTASMRADFNPLTPLTAGELAVDETFVINITVGA